jgi:peptide-methionine (S)-S-oxide reductase
MTKTSFAYFGGGCFWCTESIFLQLKGIVAVKPGYSGGITNHPTYETVSKGDSGHAEIIQIEYEPRMISYKTLLTVFFSTHDPTALDRQGHDQGSQYRSLILTKSYREKAEVAEKIAELNRLQIFDRPIVTKVETLKVFYEAEKYHHNYFNNHQTAPYCQIVIFPKINYLKKEFSHLLK